MTRSEYAEFLRSIGENREPAENGVLRPEDLECVCWMCEEFDGWRARLLSLLESRLERETREPDNDRYEWMSI